MVLNGVSSQIRPLTPDLVLQRSNYTYSFFLFSAGRSETLSSRIQWRVRIFTCCVFCLAAPPVLASVMLSVCLSVCQGGRSCWIESGSSPWQSSTGSYGSLAMAGWLHAVTRRQGIIKTVLVLRQTHIHIYYVAHHHTARSHRRIAYTFNNNGLIQTYDHYGIRGCICLPPRLCF